MGFRSDMRTFASFADSLMNSNATVGVKSPWSGNLSKVIFDDDMATLFGLDGLMTREQAMTIPGVYRARGILLTLLADKPLINELGQIELANQDGGWDVADEDEVILIPGPSEGLLAHASRTLRGAADLERAWVSRAKTPAPLTELHVTDDVALDDEEIVATRDAWVAARRAADGAVAVTPSNIQVIDHGQADAALFENARNASRIDLAHFFNMPGAILDATTAQASLTYVTQEGTRTSLYDLTLPFWARPIEARLSQDDICAAGQSVRFDFSTLAPNQPHVITAD
jgi:hypothetical protein